MNKVHKPLYFYLMLFFSTTIIGALLLYLPFTGKKPISFLDALFIASSAFTVTGLSPVDIGSQFNTMQHMGLVEKSIKLFLKKGKSSIIKS